MSGQEEDQDEAGRDPGSQREDNAQPCLHRKSAIITTRQFCGSMLFSVDPYPDLDPRIHASD